MVYVVPEELPEEGRTKEPITTSISIDAFIVASIFKSVDLKNNHPKNLEFLR